MSIRRYEPSDADIGWMRRAADLARHCVREARPDRMPPPPVGVVAVRDGAELAAAYRGETGPGDHAEFGIITKLGGEGSGALAGATIYTTLEPCTERTERNTPCATRLIDEGVSRVFIGAYDPNPLVRRLGWRRMHDAGIELCDFTPEIRHELLELLAGFRQIYTHGQPDRNHATLDYNREDGHFLTRPPAEPPSRRSGVVAALTPSTPEDRLAT